MPTISEIVVGIRFLKTEDGDVVMQANTIQAMSFEEGETLPNIPWDDLDEGTQTQIRFLAVLALAAEYSYLLKDDGTSIIKIE